MADTTTTALFLFRRDLRLEDNLGLLAAHAAADQVLPAFIFDPAQVDRTKNDYFSEPAFHFLLESLAELDQALRAKGSQLYVFHGEPAAVVAALLETTSISSVFVNKDYTPFARTRDKAIADVCAAAAVSFTRVDDCALAPLETVRTNEGKVYTMFTPFMKKIAALPVPEPKPHHYTNFFTGTLTTPTVSLTDYQANVTEYTLPVQGGRTEALRLLADPHYLKDYEKRRNLPALAGTSKLSAHHKFGTISIRETFHTAKQATLDTTTFISELYWRDFYLYIAYHFPTVFKQAFLPWARNLAWINDQQQFAAWCAGKTGVPIVDAAMRELRTTGWMHNRARMIVASYLTKNLLIDWRWGERYFAQHLIDYDPSQNNGGWQWSASTGADPRPIRIFNPFTQATKYDPDAVYIKRWVPELANVPAAKLTDGKTQDFSQLAPGYPAPLVDQKESYRRAQAVYKAAKQTAT